MKDNPRIISIYLLAFLLFAVVSNAKAQENSNLTWPSNVTAGDNKDNVLVDFDLKDVDIKDIARSLSRISGKNIVVTEEVKAKITLKLKNVDWREALNMIVGTYNFALVEEDNYIIITTYDKRRQVEERGDLETKIITLNFISVAQVQKTLASMLTSRGKIEIDPRTNSLVITDIGPRIERIRNIAVGLDTKTPQVMIEAMMLDVKLTKEEQMGINWTMTSKNMPERFIRESLGLSGAASGVIQYGKTIFPGADLTAIIGFWLEDKKVNILANPKILTLDNLAANIDIAEQIPYTQQSTTDQGSVSSTQFKDVGIKLSVTPHITKDNYILLNIKTEQSFRSGFTPDNQPIIDSRKAETNLMVKDGETIVIGGLRKREDASTTDNVPFFSKIPFVGNFFKRNNRSQIENELLIFVTPRVSVDASLSAQELKEMAIFEEMKKISVTKPNYNKDKLFP